VRQPAQGCRAQCHSDRRASAGAARCSSLTVWLWLVVALGAASAVWSLLVLALVLLGRRRDAREVARFVPDCIILLKRLLRDPRVPRRAKVAVALLVAYLALPFDVVPDFIPVVGQLDDVILVALTIAYVARLAGDEVIERSWPGSPRGLRVVRRLAP
jgi:uncharacterized membrane protein YkvA (DUF1232 family)